MPPKGKRKIVPLGGDMIVLRGVCIAIVMGSFLAYRPILFQNLFGEKLCHLGKCTGLMSHHLVR